ncbi:MAG: lipocalin-like domain-containing protein [Verrucomicrobiota bacterium]|jgi:predicted secreted hydrolase
MKKIFLIILTAMISMSGYAGDSSLTADRFSLPQPGHVFAFPRDYGSHNDFKIEWWYITGHLFGEDGRRFGFQATFFRSAQSPPDALADTNFSDFDDNTIFLAHMALLDVNNGSFIYQQRLNRSGWDASAAPDRLDVRNGSWSLRMTDTNLQTMSLLGSVGGQASLQLELKPLKPLVVFGSNSVSRKAAEPSAASYYLTFPRLRVVGQVVVSDETNQVRGEAWMDHEISSSQLGANQSGWDWCCLQFKDGREIMAYRMRRKDGTQDDYSTLAWVDTNGKVTQLSSVWFHMETVQTWRSPQTGAVYPVSIRLFTQDVADGRPVNFLLEPLAKNQELAGGGNIAYWEGSCRVRDDQGREVGSAFLELTGYAGNLQKDLH